MISEEPSMREKEGKFWAIERNCQIRWEMWRILDLWQVGRARGSVLRQNRVPGSTFLARGRRIGSPSTTRIGLISEKKQLTYLGRMKIEHENAICAVKNDDLVAFRFPRRITRRSWKPGNILLEIVHGSVPIFQKLVTKEVVGNERKLSSTVLKKG